MNRRTSLASVVRELESRSKLRGGYRVAADLRFVRRRHLTSLAALVRLAAASKEQPRARAIAIWLLGQTGSPKFRPLALRLLERSSRQIVIWEAAKAAFAVTPPEEQRNLVRRLRVMLTGSNSVSRSLAILWVLEFIGTKEAARAIAEVREEPRVRKVVRQRATEALEVIRSPEAIRARRRGPQRRNRPKQLGD